MREPVGGASTLLIMYSPIPQRIRNNRALRNARNAILFVRKPMAKKSAPEATRLPNIQIIIFSRYLLRSIFGLLWILPAVIKRRSCYDGDDRKHANKQPIEYTLRGKPKHFHHGSTTTGSSLICVGKLAPVTCPSGRSGGKVSAGNPGQWLRIRVGWCQAGQDRPVGGMNWSKSCKNTIMAAY